MSVNKSYNRLALQGLDFDDMEFVQQFKLDPAVAYTPKINDVMLDDVYNKNIRSFMADGMSENDAKREAGRLRAKAKAEINALM